MAKNRWEPSQSQQHKDVLSQRVYSSRLIGADEDLVLHGGGNTSAKAQLTNLWGESEDILYIKGSGWDLATIEAPGFAAVRLNPLKKARALSSLSDLDMENLLRTHLTVSSMPTPSVEALLHAFIPETFVDHTHADAILTLTNQPDHLKIIRTVFEDRVGIVPYIMPGFALAKLCADIYDRSPRIEGLILINHGIFTFGSTAKESYERMINLVTRAQEYIEQCKKKRPSLLTPRLNKTISAPHDQAVALSTLTRVFTQEGFPPVLNLDISPTTLTFLSQPNAQDLTQCGPVTPDHIIRTKRVPLFLELMSEAQFESDLKTALSEYKHAYQRYFTTHAKTSSQSLTMLDPFPRIILVPGLGCVAIGKTRKDAKIAQDIYQHTIKVIQDAEAVGIYQALPEKDLFDVEYWVLEQAKLKKAKAPDEFTGKTVVITGGSSGIGHALCGRYGQHQTQVFNLDIHPPKAATSAIYLETDIRSQEAVASAFEKVILETGKIDIVVINAGIFPESQTIEDLSSELWQKSLDINLNGAFYTAQAAVRWLGQNPAGGQVIFVASKNVPAPGRKAAAYSVMKAAQTQLARVLALESGAKGIRVNIVHPNMVFDTGIWTEPVIQARAKSYGLTPEAYKKNNLLQTELKSTDVAETIVALTSKAFSKTTGTQIPIDGGNERII